MKPTTFKDRYTIIEEGVINHLKQNKGKYLGGLTAAAGLGSKLAMMHSGEVEDDQNRAETFAPKPDLAQTTSNSISADTANILKGVNTTNQDVAQEKQAQFAQDEADYNKNLDLPDTNVDWAKEKQQAQFAQDEKDYNKNLDLPDTNVDWAKEKHQAHFAQDEKDYNNNLDLPDTDVDWAKDKRDGIRTDLLARQNRGMFDDTFKNVEQSISGFGDKVTGAISDAGESASKFGQGVKQTGAAVGGLVAGAADTVKDDLSQKVQGMKDSVTGSIKDSSIYQAGQEGLDKFGKFVDDNAAEARRANALQALKAQENAKYNTALATAKADGFDPGMVVDDRDTEYLLSAEKAGVLSPSEKIILARYKQDGHIN